MKLRIFKPAIHPSGKLGFEAIVAGCTAVGDDIAYTSNIEEECDVAVHASGIKGGEQRASGLSTARARLMERFGKNRLILESAAIRPGIERVESMGDRYWRLSLGGFLNDEAEYANENSPPDRWKRIAGEQGIEPIPFHVPDAGHVLVMLQKPSDASLRGIDTYRWAEDTCVEIRRHVLWPIVIRRHPLDTTAQGLPPIPNARMSAGHESDWKDARAVVTLTSLSAIDSMLRGLPTWTMSPGNLAWPVTNHDLSNLTQPQWPSTKDFDQWLWNLGYMQWTATEIATGRPWTRLRQKLSVNA